MNFGPSFVLKHDILGANAISEVQPMSPADRLVRLFSCSYCVLIFCGSGDFICRYFFLCSDVGPLHLLCRYTKIGFD